MDCWVCAETEQMNQVKFFWTRLSVSLKFYPPYSFYLPKFCRKFTDADLSIALWVAAAAKSLQSCLTLCNSIDGSPPGSSIPGILQARTLEWVAISFSNTWKWKVTVKSLNRVQLFAIPWTAAYQAPPSMGVSRQEYQNGSPVPSPALRVSPCKYVALVFSLGPLSSFLLLPFNQRKNNIILTKRPTRPKDPKDRLWGLSS